MCAHTHLAAVVALDDRALRRGEQMHLELLLALRAVEAVAQPPRRHALFLVVGESESGGLLFEHFDGVPSAGHLTRRVPQRE